MHLLASSDQAVVRFCAFRTKKDIIGMKTKAILCTSLLRVGLAPISALKLKPLDYSRIPPYNFVQVERLQKRKNSTVNDDISKAFFSIRKTFFRLDHGRSACMTVRGFDLRIQATVF